MKSKLTFFILAISGIATFLGCSQKSPWESPKAGLISSNDGSLFYIVPKSTPGVALFYMGDMSSSASHSSNPKTMTYDCLGALTIKEKNVIEYELRSENSEFIIINRKRYNLNEGQVFLIVDQGTIKQLPFAPLPPSREYLERTIKHLDANKSLEATATSAAPQL